MPPNLNIDVTPKNKQPAHKANKYVKLVIDLSNYSDAVEKIKPILAKMFNDVLITEKNKKIYIEC